MKILMLVNWPVYLKNKRVTNLSEANYYIPSTPFWFFNYLVKKEKITVNVIDNRAPPIIHFFEKKLKIYVFQVFRALLSMKEYDVILSHSANSGFILAFLRKILNIKNPKHVIIDIGSLNGGKNYPLQIKIINYLMESVDFLLYHSRITKKIYSKYYKQLLKKSKFIHLGINPDMFAPEKRTSKQKYVLSFGMEKRDWKTLFKAFRSIKGKLIVVGKCTELDVPKNVILLKPVSIDKLKMLINNSLFIIAPIDDIPYSVGQLTVLNSMSMGKLVIASNVPGISDYIIDGVNGILYPPNNENELKKKIQYFLSNPSLSNSIGTEARKMVISRFNEKKMALRIFRILKKLV